MQKVRKGEELNEQPLKVFLKDQQLISDTKADWQVSQFSTGFSNLTYLIKIEGKELVLRRPPKGAIKRGHDMGREFKVLKDSLNRLCSSVYNSCIFLRSQKSDRFAVRPPMAVRKDLLSTSYQPDCRSGGRESDI